ncbi:hypothetical protein [Mycolicibacterium conceptionense]|uniref:hypothetical protein n=1 Tax=Mycolicibacterium conceptionense TaxID=451644 RepID=UPI00320485FD
MVNPVESDEAVMRQVRESVDRENSALALVLQRAELSEAELEAVRAVLRKLALVRLDDLRVPPGFNLLPDGEVGSVNSDTPEWRSYQTAKAFIDDADHLERSLFCAHRRALELTRRPGNADES